VELESVGILWGRQETLSGAKFKRKYMKHYCRVDLRNIREYQQSSTKRIHKNACQDSLNNKQIIQKASSHVPSNHPEKIMHEENSERITPIPTSGK
jgi:hypothetical protein